MTLSTLIVAVGLTTVVFFTARASKLGSLLQIVLSLISFIVSIIIYSQWTHNPLLTTIIAVLIGVTVNLTLILLLQNWLPAIELSFQNKPLKSHLLLALVVIFLLCYVAFWFLIGLVGNNISYPIAIMLSTGGITTMVGVIFISFRVFRLSIHTKG